MGPDQKLGSDPVKWLLLKRYRLKKGYFLLLECTFWGQKVGFKDFEPCYGCWVVLKAVGISRAGVSRGLTQSSIID